MGLLSTSMDWAWQLKGRYPKPPHLIDEDFDKKRDKVVGDFKRDWTTVWATQSETSATPYYKDGDRCYTHLALETPIRTGLETVYKESHQSQQGLAHFLKKMGNRKLMVFIPWWRISSQAFLYRMGEWFLKNGYDVLFIEPPAHLSRNLFGLRSGDLFLSNDHQLSALQFARAICEIQMLFKAAPLKSYAQVSAIGCDIGATLLMHALATNPVALKHEFYVSPLWLDHHKCTDSRMFKSLLQRSPTPYQFPWHQEKSSQQRWIIAAKNDRISPLPQSVETQLSRCDTNLILINKSRSQCILQHPSILKSQGLLS